MKSVQDTLENSIYTHPRLAWACKRGMLECDLFLAPLLKNQFSILSDIEKKMLYDLLQYPDPVLYEWFMGKTKPTGVDACFESLIQKIQWLKVQSDA